MSFLRALAVRVAPTLLFRLGFHRAWRRIPRRLRKRFVSRVTALPRRRPEDRAAGIVGPVYVLGFASSHTSLGWTMRSVLRTLRTQGFAPIVIDIADRFGTRHLGSREGGATDLARVPPGPGTVVLNVNPDQIGYALAGIADDALRGKWVIGYCVWDLERIPEAWKPPLDVLDEIWVPTRFVANAFAAEPHGRPIRLVPYRIDPPEDVVRAPTRFGLPADRFLVLCGANLRSGVARKNLAGAMDAFERAFVCEPSQARAHGFEHEIGDGIGEDGRATLVVKLHDAHLAPQTAGPIRDRARSLGAVVIEEDLDDAAMWSLVASCDAVLSMHRAEGYGLLLKQGLLLDKPVVATGWSGNMDFMEGHPLAHPVRWHPVPVEDPEGIYETDRGLTWADPSADHAAAILRDLAERHLAERHIEA